MPVARDPCYYRVLLLPYQVSEYNNGSCFSDFKLPSYLHITFYVIRSRYLLADLSASPNLKTPYNCVWGG